MIADVFHRLKPEDASGKFPGSVDLAAGRRVFFQSVAMSLAGAAVIGSATQVSAQAAGISDIDIFNFALNLEYLEAEFYQRAAFGRGLQAGDIEGTGTQGTVEGGRQVPFADANIGKYAIEIANDELAHVRLLRRALGSNAVSRPSIDLGLSFTLAARGSSARKTRSTCSPTRIISRCPPSSSRMSTSRH